jgi:hypothetical protein
MYSRKLALTQAWQHRTCPPPEIAADPLQEEYMKQHLSICPHCSSGETERLKIWNVLCERLKEIFPPAEDIPGKPTVSVGQLRFLKPEMAGWHNRYFYNPPCVLILETAGKIADEILVAQIYHDISLAAPGDLILDKARSGAGDMFVECWNTYTLKSSYLGPVIGSVKLEIIEAVKKLEQQPESLPDWALLPKPLAEHDTRLYFRELEVEVGYIYASRAATEIMVALEQPQLDYGSNDELQKDIINSAKVIEFRRPAANLEEILTSAEFPAHAYAKAAADDDRESLPANLVILQNGKISAFKPIQGIVTSKKRSESSLKISGAFPLLDRAASNPSMICFYWSRATGAMVPDDMNWEVSTGIFHAKFTTEFQDDEKLEFALVYEIDGE